MIRDWPRALALLERSLSGVTLIAVAAEFGLSSSRASILCTTAARTLLAPHRRTQEPVPNHDCDNYIARRKQAGFWLRQIEKARQRQDFPDATNARF